MELLNNYIQINLEKKIKSNMNLGRMDAKLI
jgi:hypothetical protein